MASAVLAAALLVAAPAAAATCAFDGPTATVTIDVGNGETASIVRVGDAIALDGIACDAASVTTTDAIVVNATGIPAAVVIDLSGGGFEPGLTPETDTGASEIEFTINLPAGSPVVRIAGSSSDDSIVAGAGGLNLNAAEAVGDADVLIVGLPTVIVEGAGGSDVLSVAGGSGTGGPSTATLDGGTEADILVGAAGGNMFAGGDGSDTLDYAAATQLLDANLVTGMVLHVANQADQVTGIENVTGSPGDDTLVGDDAANVLLGGGGSDILVGGGGDDELDGGAGLDTVDYSQATGPVVVRLDEAAAGSLGVDRISKIENVIGTAFADELSGNDDANVLEGGEGDDRIDGGGGDDTIDGGPGMDQVAFGLSDAGVVVSLAKGTASGAGADLLVAIEGVIGSGKADTINGDGGNNRLAGAGGGDTINGRAGGDQLQGGRGQDRLFGQKGNDVLLGESGNDQLNGGKGSDDHCRGGPGSDSFVFCETIKL